MSSYVVKLENIAKSFGRLLVFQEINYEFVSPFIYGISGSNGSGKSTLSKIIAGLTSATKGKVIHSTDGRQIEEEELHRYLGFVSPYLTLYSEFTAEENLKHFARIRGIAYEEDYTNELLNTFGLYKRRKDFLKGYSSGMLQRMKFVFALQHKPKLLILDEPTSNLDADGKAIVYRTVEDYAQENLVIIASNEDSDLNLCKEILNIEEFKN